MHREQQAAGPRWIVEQQGELTGDTGVLKAGRGDPEADTLPNLVEAIHADLAAALKQRLQLQWWRTEHKASTVRCRDGLLAPALDLKRG